MGTRHERPLLGRGNAGSRYAGDKVRASAATRMQTEATRQPRARIRTACAHTHTHTRGKSEIIGV